MKKIELEGITFDQKGQKMILTCPSVEQIRSLFYVFRKTRDDPEALQRQLITAKIHDIHNSADKAGIFFPNAIITNITETDKMKINKISGNFVKISFDISDITNENVELEDATGKIGYIIDGQHRTEGLKEYPNFNLPVIMFLDVERDVAFKTFADINENQDKVSKILLSYIKWELNDFSSNDPTPKAYESVMALDTHTDSPLNGKIKLFEGEKGKWVASTALTKELKHVIGVDGPMQHLTELQQLIILKNYLNAWKDLYPNAWDETTRDKYVLTKSMGLTIILRLFSRFYRRCVLYQGDKHEIINFKNEINPLLKTDIPIDEYSIPLDWSSENFGKMSSGKGINNLVRILLGIIPEQGNPNI